jgi:hypothetical protein
MRDYQTATNNTCPDINVDLLLMPRLVYTMRIVLCPLVVVVDIYDAVFTKTCLI